jgi:hypothetical protein
MHAHEMIRRRDREHAAIVFGKETDRRRATEHGGARRCSGAPTKLGSIATVARIGTQAATRLELIVDEQRREATAGAFDSGRESCGSSTDHADVDVLVFDRRELGRSVRGQLAETRQLTHDFVRELVQHGAASHQRVMIHAAREQEVDRTEQIDLGRWKCVLTFDLRTLRAWRLTRAKVRHATEPHEAAAAVTFEAEERARAVILQRARKDVRAARDCSGCNALVGVRAHTLVRDAQFECVSASCVEGRKATCHTQRNIAAQVITNTADVRKHAS